MKIIPQFKHLYTYENDSRILNLEIENKYKNNAIKLVFLTPTNDIFITENLAAEREEQDKMFFSYSLSRELLTCPGNLFCQIQIDDGDKFLVKGEILILRVERGLNRTSNLL